MGVGQRQERLSPLIRALALVVAGRRLIETREFFDRGIDSTAHMRFNVEAPELFVLRDESLCHRGQQAIDPDRRSGEPSKTTACSGKSRTYPAPPASRE